MAGLYIQTSTHILTPTDDIPVRIDISTIDNGEIGEVLGDLSQGFQIAGTEEHNRFFNSAFDVAGQTINGVSQSIECSINNEVETLAYGTLTLESWDPVDKIYSCAFSSGVVSLADSLEGALVRDAGWSDLDHTYTMDHAISQNTMQSLPTYFYPMVDFGFDEATQPRVPNDVTLASVPISGANQQTSYYNTNYFQQQYNSLYVGQQTPATTSRLYTPSIYFGEVAQGGEIQGYITHPMTPLRIHQLLPAVQVTEVIDRIFRQAGKTYTADFFPMIADQYILPKANEGLGFEGNFTDDIGFISTNSNYNVPELNIYQTARKRGQYRRIWKYGSTSGTTASFNPGNNWNSSNGNYTAPRTGGYEFQFTGTLDNVSGRLDNVFNNAFLEMAVSILVNGNRVESIDLPRIGNRDDFNNGEPFTWDLTWSGPVYEGQVVTAELGVTGSRSADDLSGTISNLSFRTRQVPIDYNGETISLGAQFGDTESLELLNAIVSQYNLVIEQSRDRADHYNIHQYYDWVLAGPRVDWTDRVDEDSITFEALLPEQSRVVEFTGTEDDDRLNQETIELFVDETYGKHTYTSTSDIPSGDRTVGDFFGPLVVASPSEAGNITKPVTTSVANGIPHLYDWDGSEAKSFQPAMRIGYRKMISWPSEIFYANANNNIVRYPGDSIVTLSNTNDAGTQDINFSSTGQYSDSTIPDAYDMYWSDYINHIYNPANRKMTCRVSFTPSEYATLRMNSIVSIKGNDYLIKEIQGFNLSEPDSVMVELITYQNNFQTVFTEPTNQFYELDEDERTHLVGLTVVGVDDDMITVIPNSVEGNNHFFRYSGDVGDSETQTYTIAAQPGFEVNVSNFTNNSASLPGVTVSNVVENADGTISVDVTTEILAEHTYSALTFTGEVDRELPGNFDFGINWLLDASVTGATIQGLGDVRGPEGGRSVILATIAPPDGFRLNASSFTHGTLPTGVISVTFAQFGFNVIATATVEYQSMNVNQTVNVNGDAPTALPSGVSTSTVTLDFTETIANVSTIQDLTFTGVVGTRSDLSIPLYAADGFTLNSGNFSATVGAGHGYVTMFDAVGGGDSVQLPIAVVFPSSDATVPITLNGSAQAIGADVFDITVTWVTSGLTNASLTENTETFSLNAGQSIKYTNDVIPTSGYNINTVTVVETSDVMNVVSDIRTNARGDGSQIHCQITAGSADATATLTVTGTAVAEDHFIRFDINSQQLVFAGTDMISHIEGFDTDETGDAYNFSFNLNAMGNYFYTASNLPTITVGSAVLADGGGAASITTPIATVGTPDSNGNVSISIGGTFPMTPQDVVIPITVTTEAGLGPATRAQFSLDTLNVPLTGDTYTVAVNSNGRWDVLNAADSMVGSGVGDGAFSFTLSAVTSATTTRFDLHADGDTSTPLDTITINQVPDGEVEFGTQNINFTINGSNASLADNVSTESITVPIGTSSVYRNQIVAAGGYNLTSVTATDSGGANIGVITLVGDEIAIWSYNYNVTSATPSDIDVTFNVTTEREPNTLILNVVNNVSGTEINQAQWRFDYDANEATESIVTDFGPQTITIQSTDAARRFTSASQISVSGFGTGTPTYNNGVISIPITGAYGTPGENRLRTAEVVINPATSDGAAPQRPATTASVTNNVSTIPGAGGTVGITVVANGAWRAHSRGRPFDGQVYDIAAGVAGNISPFQGEAGTHEISVSMVALSQQTNGDSVTSGGWQLDIVPSNSTTRLATTQVSQSSSVSPEVRFVSSLPANEIASVLYIYPDS